MQGRHFRYTLTLIMEDQLSTKDLHGNITPSLVRILSFEEAKNKILENSMNNYDRPLIVESFSRFAKKNEHFCGFLILI